MESAATRIAVVCTAIGAPIVLISIIIMLRLLLHKMRCTGETGGVIIERELIVGNAVVDRKHMDNITHTRDKAQYKLTIKYKDKTGKSYKHGVKTSNYECRKGDEVQIWYNPEKIDESFTKLDKQAKDIIPVLVFGLCWVLIAFGAMMGWVKV